MNDILVLMSSYNGEKYIKQQIDSILCQDEVNVFLLIRDDGSTDSTVSIINEYQEAHPNVEVIRGDNIGVIPSFNQLMSNEKCRNYRYLAFSDQDDCWLPQKAITAIRAIEGHKGLPCLYSCNPMLIDTHDKEIGKMREYEPVINERSSLVENFAPGCATVFNHKAWELYCTGITGHMEMHDYWMYMCCVFLGKVIYSDEPTVLYRQHESNTVGSKKKSISRYLSNLAKTGDHIREKSLTSFAEIYSDRLSSEQNDLLLHASGYRKTIKDYLWMLFSGGFNTGSKGMIMAFKLRIALRKM